jgi:PST family polysaccharide transporter
VSQNLANQSSRTVGWLAWTGASRVILLFGNIVSVVVLARLLTPDDYGVFAIAMVFLNVGKSAFTSGGMSSTIIQRASLTTSHIRNAFTGMITTRLVFAVVLWFGADLCAEFFEMPQLVDILRVVCGILVINAVTLVSTALLRRRKEFRKLATIEVVATILGNTAVAIALAAAGFGVWSLVIAQVTLTLTSAALAYNAVRFNPLPLIDSHMRDLFGLGAGFSIGSGFNRIAILADNLIVGRVLGADALGIYSRAYRLLTIPVNILGSTAMQVLFPVMSGINKGEHVENERERMRRGYLRALALAAMITGPLSVLIVHSAEGFVLLALGDQWDAAVFPLQVLFVCLAFRIGMKIVSVIPMALGRVRDMIMRQVVFASLVVGGALLGTRWGVDGVAVAVSTAIFITFMLNAQVANRLVDVSFISFARAHLHAFLLSSLLLGVLVLGQQFVWHDVATIWVFPIEAAVAGLLFYGSCHLGGRWLLGPEGAWLLDELRRRVPGRLRSLVPVVRA